ncbi:MAG TPA: hypothetical protein IAD39_08855, partial [Candidatus Merdisoma faecalis]|nr:hypothetical protein [Candidatus Merdisoma faecalis]
MLRKRRRKRGTVTRKFLFILLLAAAVVYVGGVFYYHSHFLRGTVIDRIDVSNMTVQDLLEQVQDYSLRITERQSDGSTLEETLSGKDISLQYSSAEPLEELLSQQNKWLWFLASGETYEMEGLVTYEEEALKEQIQQLKGFQEDFAVSPTDAHISEYTPENGFQIIA